MSQTWKAIERKIAAYLGGERVPVSGRTGDRGMEAPDIEHGTWAIELKHRAPPIVPKWQQQAMVQAKASLKPGHTAPVVIIHEKGTRIDQALCMMPLEYLKAIQDIIKAS